MVQRRSWEANWFAASQEIPRILRNSKVHYRTHKRPAPVFTLGQPNPVHIPTSQLLGIHPNIIHPSTLRSPQWSPSLRFPHQEPIHPLSSPIRATCPAHLILLDFITRTILREEYKSFSSSLCNLLHSPVTSSLLGPNILLNTMFSNTLSFLSSRNKILLTVHNSLWHSRNYLYRKGARGIVKSHILWPRCVFLLTGFVTSCTVPPSGSASAHPTSHSLVQRIIILRHVLPSIFTQSIYNARSNIIWNSVRQHNHLITVIPGANEDNSCGITFVGRNLR